MSIDDTLVPSKAQSAHPGAGPRATGLLSPSNAHYRRPLQHTPFFEASQPWVQTDVFVGWGGYCVPDVYTSVEQEYFAIRNGASLLDLTPVVKYRVSGPDAERFLNRLVTCDVRRLKTGKVGYAVLCDDHGHVIDDWLVFRFGPQDYIFFGRDREVREILTDLQALID